MDTDRRRSHDFIDGEVRLGWVYRTCLVLIYRPLADSVYNDFFFFLILYSHKINIIKFQIWLIFLNRVGEWIECD